MAGSKSASTATDPSIRGPVRGRAWWVRGLEAPRTFLLGILLLLVLLAIWARLAVVDKVVRVEGRIVPAGRSQQIQHLEGGIVATINTQEGALVHRGDLLLTIDATSVGATLSETAVKLAGQQARAARLEAEGRGSGAIAFPPDLEKSDVAAEERRLFQIRRQQLAQEVRVFEEQYRQRDAELRELDSRRTQLSAELATATERSALLAGLASRNAASRLEIIDASSREKRLETELASATASIPKVRAAIAEARARIDEAQTRFQSQTQADLVATRVEVDRLQQIMTAQTDRVSRTDVRAPTDGVINRIQVNTVGGVIRPGDVIVELTPTSGRLQIEAQAMPRDRGDLRPGLDVRVRLSAYDAGLLGPLDGRVSEISADTVPDGKKDPFYRVGIFVDSLPPAYADKLITPGMTVTGDVVTGQRTVWQYILSPLTNFTDNAFRDAR